MSPSISICLPVWNGAKFVEEAIQSVLLQTYSDFELIVIDDCSTDSSAEIVHKLAASDDRICFHVNESRLGLFGNYNQCIKIAEGKYIKPFAQDDLLLPTNLENLLRLMESNQDLGLVSCRRSWFDEQGQDLADGFAYPSAADYFESGFPIRHDEVMRRSIFPILNFIGEPAAVLFPKALAGKGFNLDFKHIGDLEYWLRILSDRAYMCTGEVLCKIREHPGRQTVRNFQDLSSATDLLSFVRAVEPLASKCGFPTENLLNSAIIEISQHLHSRLNDGIVQIPSGKDNALLELCFRGLDLLGRLSAASAPDYGVPREIGLNQRHIERLEKHLRRLLSGWSWRLTRPLREIYKLFSSARNECGDIHKQESLCSNDFQDVLFWQQAYLRSLKTLIWNLKLSRSWTITHALPRRKAPLHPELSSAKLAIFATLPRAARALSYVQSAVSIKPKVSSLPVTDLIAERLFERSGSADPLISIVIGACHDKVGQTILALNNQTLDVSSYEVIVVDSVSTGQIAADFAVLSSSPNFHLQLSAVRTVPGGRALALNVALKLCRSELVIFLAGDYIPERAFVESHLNFHRLHPDYHSVAVGAGIFPPAMRKDAFSSWLEDSGNLFGISFTSQPVNMPESFFYVGNSSVKKKLIASAGYFDEDFMGDAWDDYEIQLRLNKVGMKSHFVEAVNCRHNHVITLEDRCEMQRGAGRAALVLDCKYPGSKSWHAYFGRTSEEYQEAAVEHLQKFQSQACPKEQESYWTSLLTACFVEGYTDALKNVLA